MPKSSLRADLIVENSIVVELKSIEEVAPVHKKILLTYLRLADKQVGLILNFGKELLKNGIHRVVNNFQDANNDNAAQRPPQSPN